MSIFIYTFLIFVVFSLLSLVRNDLWNLYGFFLLSIIAILIPGIRDISVGTDTSYYVEYFLHPERGYRGLEVDTGYYYLNVIVEAIWRNEHLLLLCNAILSMGGVIFVIYKMSPNRIISLFLSVTYYHFYALQLSGMRQSVAISLFLVSFYYYDQGKPYYKKALFFYCMSALFHATVLWCLPVVLFLKNKTLTKKKAYIFLAVSVVIALSGVFDFRTAISFAFSILSVVGGYAVDRYDSYADFLIDHVMPFRRVVMGVIPLTGIAIVAIYKAKKVNTLLLKTFLAGVVLGNIIVTFPIGNRIIIYFTLLMCVSLPISLDKQTWKALSVYSLVIAYFSYNFYSILKVQMSTIIVEGDKIVPYYFFFNGF